MKNPKNEPAPAENVQPAEQAEPTYITQTCRDPKTGELTTGQSAKSEKE